MSVGDREGGLALLEKELVWQLLEYCKSDEWRQFRRGSLPCAILFST